MPPEPGAQTRSVSLGRGALRNAFVGFAAMIGAVGLWSAATAHVAVVTNEQLADARQLILSLNDSVHTLNVRVQHDIEVANTPPHLIFPVVGALTSRFERSRFHPILQLFRPHRGIDLSAPAGTRIVAPADGTVSFVGWRIGDGLTVEINHAGAMTTLYGHCQTTLVKVGQRVHASEPIATVGSSGLATGPHVHFEVRIRGTPIDPMRYLAARPASEERPSVAAADP